MTDPELDPLEPDPTVQRIVDRALGVTVNVAAVDASLDQERAKYRDRTSAVLKRADETVEAYVWDTEVTDDRRDAALQYKEMLGGGVVDQGFADKSVQLEAARPAVDGKVVGQLTPDSFATLGEDAWMAVGPIAEWASHQACALLGLDPSEHAIARVEAAEEIRKRMTRK